MSWALPGAGAIVRVSGWGEVLAMVNPRLPPGAGPDGRRVVAMLRTLAELTSDQAGAQRVAWTGVWQKARAFLREQLRGLPVTVQADAAGNQWARLPGGGSGVVIIGSHLDSVPDGGWLDGAYGVMCAVEVMRCLAARGPLPCTLALVEWADEEGARFGHSLFGSSAVAGTLNVAEVRELTDAEGLRLGDVVAEHGVLLDRLGEARGEIGGARAYLEAHIEQGPVLDKEGLPIGAVSGTVGVERHRVIFRGQTAHSGSTPMGVRRDAFLAAAATALAVRASAVRHQGVGTVGAASLRPGIVTAVAGETAILVDQRHPDAGALEAMLAEAQRASHEAARAEGCVVSWEPLFGARPQPFAAELVDVAREVCSELTGQERVLPSWALHDATPMAGVVPTAMVFTSSTNGISHAREEDTPEDHLRLGVEAFYQTVCRVIARSSAGASTRRSEAPGVPGGLWRGGMDSAGGNRLGRRPPFPPDQPVDP
jgi:hydantoinase/carbamoylase family amidase